MQNSHREKSRNSAIFRAKTKVKTVLESARREEQFKHKILGIRAMMCPQMFTGNFVATTPRGKKYEKDKKSDRYLFLVIIGPESIFMLLG